MIYQSYKANYKMKGGQTYQNKLEKEIINGVSCGSTHNLNVHHINYVKGLKAYEYPKESLITLCEKCHEKLHIEKNMKLLDNVNIGDKYAYDHSDFTNYNLVSDIDYISKTITLMGVDTGGGWDSIWFKSYTFDGFDKFCYPYIFDNEEDFSLEILAKDLIILENHFKEKNINIFISQMVQNEQDIYKSYANIKVFLDSDELLKENIIIINNMNFKIKI